MPPKPAAVGSYSSWGKLYGFHFPRADPLGGEPEKSLTCRERPREPELPCGAAGSGGTESIPSRRGRGQLCVGGTVGPVRGCFPGISGFSHGEHPKNLSMHSHAQLSFLHLNLPPFQVQYPVSPSWGWSLRGTGWVQVSPRYSQVSMALSQP